MGDFLFVGTFRNNCFCHFSTVAESRKNFRENIFQMP